LHANRGERQDESPTVDDDLSLAVIDVRVAQARFDDGDEPVGLSVDGRAKGLQRGFLDLRPAVRLRLYRRHRLRPCDG
jgi:hypothetical protein